MRTILDNVTVQSLPTRFADTLRQRILDIGTACDTASPWYFDTTARRLGELVASSHHTAIYDSRRRMLLTPPEDFIPALDLAKKTTPTHNTQHTT